MGGFTLLVEKMLSQNIDLNLLLLTKDTVSIIIVGINKHHVLINFCHVNQVDDIHKVKACIICTVITHLNSKVALAHL